MWTPFRPRMRKSSSRQPLRGTRVPRFEPLEARLALATYNVMSSADSGAGTLRQAILDANASSGADHIQFNIPGGGVHTIQPLSPLPSITDAVTIDGYTQPGASPNTLATGDNAVLLIELNGSHAGDSHGLLLSAGSSTVRGLVINDFSHSGILCTSSNGNVIEGNFIGTNASGSAGSGNGLVGIWIHGGGSDTIGGSTPGARNVISGSGQYGIFLDSASNNLVQGNYVGTDKTGVHAVPNGYYGINISDGSYNHVEDNVFSGNGDPTLPYNNGPSGIAIGGFFNPCEFNTVTNNKIGVGADGTTAVANLQGVSIGGGAQHNTIEHNVIAHNIWQGVQFSPDFLPRPTPTSDNVLRNNQITNNGGNGVEIFAGNGLTYDWITTQAFTTIPDNGTQRNSIVNNYISGNGGIGVIIDGIRGNDNTVYGNTIASNGSYGVQISGGAQGNQIGGTGSGLTNSIHDNSGAGVMVRDLGYDLNLQFFPGMEHGEYTANGPFSPTANSIVHPINNAIRGNAIYNNGGPAIDLKNDGITFNDANDSDSGPNNLQNWPVLSEAVTTAGVTAITGILNTTPSGGFWIDFYAVPANADQTYLGATFVTADSGGQARYTVTFPAVPVGHIVVATATDSAGNTSEFSPAVVTTSFTPTSASPANGAIGSIAVAPPSSGTLVGLDAVTSPAPPSNPPPAGVNFPVGFVEFAVIGLTPGAASTVTLTLDVPPGQTVSEYWKYGPEPGNLNPHWYQFTFNGTTGAVITPISATQFVVTLFLKDGQRGDYDLTANGTIVDPGAPAVATNTLTTVTSGVSSAIYGQAVTFAAMLSPLDPAAGTPTGTVQFYAQGSALGAAVALTNGAASISAASLTVGMHNVTAVYASDQPAFVGSVPLSPFVETITPAQLAVVANDSTRAAGAANPTFTVSYAGFVLGEDASVLVGDLVFSTPADASSPPGDYPITVGGLSAENYNISFVEGTLTVVPLQPVDIDIRPGRLNLHSRGMLAVVLYTTANFDASLVDVGSVVFAGAHVAKSRLRDVDCDGDLDLVLKFRTQETNLLDVYAELLAEADQTVNGKLDRSVSHRQEAMLSLSGQTVDGLFFEGFDTLDLFLSGRSLRELLLDLAAAGSI